jgi:Domain of unknown function (DUF4234)
MGASFRHPHGLGDIAQANAGVVRDAQQDLRVIGSTAKTRDPLGVALLTLVTLGIYFFVWYYKVNREMSELGRARGTDELGDNPGNSLLAVTLGALIIVPAIVSVYNTFQRTQAVTRLTAVEPLNGWIAVAFFLLLGIGFPAYLQSGLNRAWGAQTDRAVAVPAAPTPAPVA